MNPKLQNLYDALERDTQNLIQNLLPLTEEQLNVQPNPAKWSLSQIINHLITAESASLQYMKKKSLGVKALKNSGTVEEVKMIVLKVSQRVPFFRYNAPRLLVEHTPPVAPLPNLVARWNEVRTDLKRFLENIDDTDLHKLVYKHPVAGRLNVLHAVSFIREHLHHHLPQIKRLL